MGNTAPLHSRVGVTLQLGTSTTCHDFYLADITDDCILGMDYLHPAGVVLNVQEQTLTIGGVTLSLSGATGSAEHVCRRVVAAVTTTLPPKSEAVVLSRNIWSPALSGPPGPSVSAISGPPLLLTVPSPWSRDMRKKSPPLLLYGIRLCYSANITCVTAHSNAVQSFVDSYSLAPTAIKPSVDVVLTVQFQVLTEQHQDRAGVL